MLRTLYLLQPGLVHRVLQGGEAGGPVGVDGAPLRQRQTLSESSAVCDGIVVSHQNLPNNFIIFPCSKTSRKQKNYIPPLSINYNKTSILLTRMSKRSSDWDAVDVALQQDYILFCTLNFIQK